MPAVTLIQQIADEYAKESMPGFEKPILRRADQIPYTYEEITDEWLTDVLCADVENAVVESHTLGGVDNGSSNRRRIELTYSQAGADAGLPASVFCKAAQSLDNRILLGVTGSLHAENTFFNEARKLVDLNIPQSYLSIYDPVSFRSILVLEDLRGRAELCNILDTTMNKARAESQIDLLAAFHGKFYLHPDLGREPLDFITWPQWFKNLEDLGIEGGAKKGFEGAESVVPARLFKHKDAVWGLTVQAAHAHTTLPHTLTHGDVHMGNWYCTDTDSMGLLDWQAVCRGHWSRDLAYAISSCLDIEDRRNWENELIGRYLSVFAEHSGQVIPFGEAHLRYRQQIFAALLFWTITLTPAESMPDMQSNDIAIRNTERISTAVDDLDSVRAFA
jgi:thiamine kinase-like enzyme